MIDHEDAYENEHPSIGRGLIIGVIFGSLFWAAIICGIVYLWY